MAFVMKCTETAFYHHMLSTMKVASFSRQAAYVNIRLYKTVQHAVQFGVASCRTRKASTQCNDVNEP